MRILLSITLILILSASTALAQTSPKPFNLYAAGGFTFGSSPQEFRDFHKEGYHIFGGLGLNMIPVIQFVGKLEYHSFSKDFDKFAPSVTDISGGTRRLLMLGVDARLGVDVPTAPVTPFIFAGLGLARSSETDLESALEDLADEVAYIDFENETDFYLNFGGGIEFKFLQVLNMFLQAKYTAVKQEGDDFVIIPVSLGIKF
ncbi:MAG: outer membrane beta-barrel protein [Candidatus Zixiibacteriota bacterium]|nr:MAG: outer membrane beta-barrel protein [candidate division Zixibacteria bacterium]